MKAYFCVKPVVLIFVLINICHKTVVSVEEYSEESDRLGGSYVYENTRPSQRGKIPEWDPNGYVFFCLCMGRTGNQLEHFIGGMAFAKMLNRTLVLPPFRTYIPDSRIERIKSTTFCVFTEWFEFDPLEAYHRVVLAEDFMEFLAPKYWPPGERYGFCWQPPNSDKTDCNMKEGNPFGPFWTGLGVDFDSSIIYHLSYNEHSAKDWMNQYPASKYPVLAMRGAPASFPSQRRHWPLQQHLHFSQRISAEADDYIKKTFNGEKFIGIHLRNGGDWINACKHAENIASYMASDQCLANTNLKVTPKICLPPKSEILRLVKNVVQETKAKFVYVATDKDPMINEIYEHLNGAGRNVKIQVVHADPWLPMTDLAVLAKSNHFIGNCVSSFTSFVRRMREVQGLPTSYWGFS